MFVPHGTVGWSTVCDCDISRSYTTLSKHSFFKHDKILLLAKKSKYMQVKHNNAKIMTVCCNICYGLINNDMHLV